MGPVQVARTALMDDDSRFMRLALEQGRLACDAQEVPVGAVLVKDGKVLAVGHNAPVAQHDPTAHAEIVAMRAAALALGNYRLDGCELFVTLEPCAMCAGAMLHARLKRVVFGASDPKTGAAGSVLNIFAQALNHQTEVKGGVLEAQCAHALQQFFQQKRALRRSGHTALREDAVRTPEACFHGLADYPWSPHYSQDLPILDGLRLHYLDEGPADAPMVFLCLHGSTSWSYAFRKLIDPWGRAGFRVVAPDLIGFGKSDKPKRTQAHTFEFHRQCIVQLVESLGLHHVVVVTQGWAGRLGLTLPLADPERYTGLLVMESLCASEDGVLSPEAPLLSSQERGAYNAPFPDAGHQAALRTVSTLLSGDMAWPLTVQVLKESWQGKIMVVRNTHNILSGLHAWDVLPEQRLGNEVTGSPISTSRVILEHSESVADAALSYFAVG